MIVVSYRISVKHTVQWFVMYRALPSPNGTYYPALYALRFTLYVLRFTFYSFKEEHRVESKLQELKGRLLDINDLQSAAAVLNWDQTTYMPPGGAPGPARQLATLGRLAHEQL